MNNHGSIAIEFSIGLIQIIPLMFVMIISMYLYSIKSLMEYQNYENIICEFSLKNSNICKSKLLKNIYRINKNISIRKLVISKKKKNIISSSFSSVLTIFKNPIEFKIHQTLDFSVLTKSKKDSLWFFY